MSTITRGCGCVTHYGFKEEERIDDDTFVCGPHAIGNHTLLCGKKSSRFPFHCMVGPDWPCMTLSYLLILVPTFFFIWDVGAVLGWWVYMVAGSTGVSTLL
jgi:hypothetical protein